MLTLRSEMSLDGIEYNFLSFNLFLEVGDFLLKLALFLSVQTVVARLSTLERAVQVLNVELSLHIQLIDLLLQSLNVLVGFFTLFSVVILLFLNSHGKSFQFILEFALHIEKYLILPSSSFVVLELLLELAVGEVMEFFADISYTGDKMVLMLDNGLVIASAVRVVS